MQYQTSQPVYFHPHQAPLHRPLPSVRLLYPRPGGCGSCLFVPFPSFRTVSLFTTHWSAPLPFTVPQFSLSSSTFTFCQFHGSLLLIPPRCLKRGSRDGGIGLWSCSIVFLFFSFRNLAISVGRRSCQLPLLLFLIFFLLFSLFCHFSLVCEITSYMYGAPCSFEHTATCWRRGIIAPLKFYHVVRSVLSLSVRCHI